MGEHIMNHIDGYFNVHYATVSRAVKKWGERCMIARLDPLGLGTNGTVNTQSLAYQHAMYLGTAWQIVLTGSFALGNTAASGFANWYESDWNNLAVDGVTFGTSQVMSGRPTIKSPSKRLEVFGNAWGYVFGQTASSTAQ